MLTISDEAWASITRPEETGTVRLGIPEDDVVALLPGILEKFSSDFPRVTVELICEPTISLTKAVAEDRVDLAIVTRFDAYPVDILGREPMLWVASKRHAVWENAPLPVAPYQTCAARANILKALAETDRSFLCTYSSASLAGMVATVQAGLAVAGVPLCSVPASLRIVGESEGLPPISELEIGILRNAQADSTAIECLHDAICRALQTVRV